MRRKLNKLMSLFMTCLLIIGMSSAVKASGTEAETLNPGEISEWTILKDDANVYIKFTGVTSNEWDKNYLTWHPISLSYDNGYEGAANIIQFTYQEEVKNGWYQSISGAALDISQRQLSSGLTANDVTVTIPLSFFADENFSLTLDDVTVESEDIMPVSEGNLADDDNDDNNNSEDENSEGGNGTQDSFGVYEGITIDGTFDDWNAVAKTSAGGSTEYQDYLKSCAVVQDGDYVYVYIQDSGIGSATWSGPHSNGRFAFVSDLGITTMFQLKSSGNGESVSVSGIDGATCAYESGAYGTSGQWEIAIPVSALPKNTGTYSFGYYQAEPYITGIQDTSKTESDIKESEFTGIVYDGLYGDWTYYPHTRIDYATSGTTDRFVDGEAALYSDGDTLFGHCVTKMSAQVSQRGEEMTQGVLLRVNQSQQMGLRFVAVDENGNINWQPDVSSLAEGTYEFYIVDNEGWSNAPTVDELKNYGNDNYGKMMLTIKADTDECEFYLDVNKLAKRFDLDVNEFQMFEVMYQRIGYKWVQTAGISTSPLLGITLSISLAGLVLFMRRKKGYRLSCKSC